MRHIFLLLLFLSHHLFALQLPAKEVTIGVLAIRPNTEIMRMYQPLADELSKNISGYHFNILPLRYAEADLAIATGKINFIMTNAGHYVAIESKFPVSNLATLIQKTDDGKPVGNLGGVIVARADRNDIIELSDLKGKKIEAVSPNAMVAYLAQAKLLYDNGIDIKKSAKITFKDRPQDELVMDVKDGKQDVAFIRASTLERMANSKLINISDFKVISPRQEKGFPYMLSTPLYPQWLFASVKNITDADRELSKQLAVTLLSIKSTDSVASTGGYYGWDIPSSTEATKQMCITLKVPPFDIEQRLSLKEVVSRYLGWILTFFITLMVVAILAVRYLRLSKKIEDDREHLELISDTMNEGLYVIDKSGKITNINDAALRELGFDRDEMMGEIAHYVFHAHAKNANMPMNKCPIYLTITANGEYHGEEYFHRKDGSTFLAGISSKVLLDKGVVVGTVTVFRDITKQKESERLIRDSETSYRGLFNSLRHAVYIQDFNGVFIDVNDGAAKMYGYDRADFIGKTPDFLSAPNRNDLSQLPSIIGNAINGTPQRFEFWGRRKNGEIFPKDVSMVRGTYFGKDVIITVAIDITRQKLLEQHLQEMVNEETDKRLEKEKLLIQQSKMAAMGEMIGAIAHQWRQPLNSLAITIQDLEIAQSFDEIDEEYVSNFSSKTMAVIHSMSNTIDDFKNFFSPNKKQEEFYIEDAIEDVLKILGAQFKTNNVDIILNNGNAIKHQYNGYKNELKQVMLNILANAKDALLESKKSSPFIKIDVAQEAGGYVVSIEDSAGGIPSQFIDKIFEPHFTTKTADKGTGIGLYMSKEIIENSLHGKLNVHNTENGAKFIIELASMDK